MSQRCETGLGAALTQNGRPVAYGSRALTQTERGYAQIGKECLVIVFGMEKFHQYTYGRPVHVKSDHKPLENIIKKPLWDAPKRLQRMLLRLQNYYLDVTYVPGHDMLLYLLIHWAERIWETVTKARETWRLRLSTWWLLYQSQQRGWMRYMQKGWEQNKKDVNIMHYFSFQDELSTQDRLVFRGERELSSLNHYRVTSPNRFTHHI